MSADRDEGCVRIAAAGDLHCRADDARRAPTSLLGLSEMGVDAVILCGDLTAHGLPEEAAVLAGVCERVTIPVVAVLGNHDWHAGRHDELVATLRAAGITVLEGAHATLEARGIEIGIAGAKGFVGGFARAHLPDFGEPSLRALYRETTAEVEALERALQAIELCPVRIVAMHYAPTSATIEGEPAGIWPLLGSERFAAPIAEHEPSLVLHGHAHAGRFEGAIGTVPVYNVSVPVIERDFWIFEIACDRSEMPIR